MRRALARVGPRGVVAGIAFTLGACNSDRQQPSTELPPETARSNTPDSVGAPVPEVGNEPVPLPATCLLAGVDEVEREDTFTLIALGYLIQTEDCRTRVLTNTMDSDQSVDWANYLLNYTYALFGCDLLFSPLPGGVDAFGLSNTDAVGVPGPMLGPDDASFLIDTYLNSCTSQLAIPSDDLAAMREHLERAATSRIDPSLSARLSDCP